MKYIVAKNALIPVTSPDEELFNTAPSRWTNDTRLHPIASDSAVGATDLLGNLFQDLQAGRVDAVVIGNEDAGAR